MNPWNHSCCYECWVKDHPGEMVVMVHQERYDACCFCAKEHRSGIYVRHDPRTLWCQGIHQER